MKSITVHGLDDELDRKIRSKARSGGQSLNRTIKGLLRAALGVGQKQQDRREDFVDLFGTWSADDSDDFGLATAGFDRIDPEDWR